jgi:hypothetical protein
MSYPKAHQRFEMAPVSPLVPLHEHLLAPPLPVLARLGLLGTVWSDAVAVPSGEHEATSNTQSSSAAGAGRCGSSDIERQASEAQRLTLCGIN